MRYEPAQPGANAHGCRHGAKALLESLQYLHWFGSKGCYNARTVRGGTATSVHAEGRAIDVAVDAWLQGRGEWTSPGGSWGKPEVADPELVRRMLETADALVAHHEQLGVQLIIFHTRIWTCDRPYWRTYTGSAGPHYDHAHIEVHPSRADDLTAAEVFAVLIPRPQPNPTEDDDDMRIIRRDDTGAIAIVGPEGKRHLQGPEWDKVWDKRIDVHVEPDVWDSIPDVA